MARHEVCASLNFMAGAEGIEPSSWLLESQVLPLNDTPRLINYTPKTGLNKAVVVKYTYYGRAGTRGGLLLGVNEAQMQLLKRAEQTVGITLGTMRRYSLS